MNSMHSNKTLVDSNLDLGLYIENLFTQDEPIVAPEQLVETEHLKTILDVELEEKPEDINLVVDEQALVPVWAQIPFDCLLLELAGMSLLVPAMSVAYVERINKKVTRIPLDMEAFKGVITLRERSVAVVDLFSLIAESATHDEEQSMRVDTHHVDHAVVMEEGHYALACDGVKKMITLEQEDVRWNKASFNNPMFSGIVTEFMCPLINIDNLYDQIAEMPFVQSLKTGS